MGLFDSLPAPTKPAASPKRRASSPAGLDGDAATKKPRQDEQEPPTGGGDASLQPPADGGCPSSAGGSTWRFGLEAAYSEDKGSRLTMEDVAVVQLDAGSSATTGCRVALLAVFDGHGGSAVARYAAEHLHTCVMAAGLEREAARMAGADSASASGGGAAQVKPCKAALAGGFRELDRRVLERCAAEGWQDGCTAVVCYVVGDTALVANVGDARCVLARRPAAPPSGEGEQEGRQEGRQQQPLAPLKAVTLTREHKAIFAQERRRIEHAGSFVSGDGRLAGRIEVSRAFGDRQFKRQGMSAVPDVQAFQLTRRDAFLLLACDGFWGVFSPQDAVDFAHHELAVKQNDVKQTCNRLIYEAIRERRCKDNCTVMLAVLREAAEPGSSA